MRMQAASNLKLKGIQQRLSNIENAIKYRALNPSKINDNLIAPFLPISTIEAIKEFDALLKTSDEAVTQFVSIIMYNTYKSRGILIILQKSFKI